MTARSSPTTVTVEDEPPPPAPPSERRPWWDLGITFTPRQALILLGLLVVGVAISFAFEWLLGRFVELDAERIEQWISDFGLLAPLVYIALLASTIIFSPLPSVVVDVAGGLAFGLFWGTLYTMAGGMIGATVNFYVARRLGRGYVERKLGAKAMGQVDSMAERMGAKAVFLTRLIPLFNFDWVSYAAGLTRISYRDYAVASAAGMLLPVIGIVYVGDVLLSHPGRSALVFSLLVVWSALPAVAFLAWFAFKWLRGWLHRRRAGLASGAE